MQAQARICPACKDDHSADVDCLQYAQRQNEVLSRRNAQLEAVAEAAIQYAGVLAIEREQLIGLAMSRGFMGWPEHAELGEQLRRVIQKDHAEIVDAGWSALAALKGGKGDG